MARFVLKRRTRSASEFVIHRLYEITSHYEAGFNEQLKMLLNLGRERFDLDIGILSRITGDRYEVVDAVAPPGLPLPPGTEFELGNTYCCVTLEADGPVGFEHVAHSEIASHPAYGAFGLESYIGAPVKVRGATYGTLNFSSVRPMERRFRDVDVECLMLMKSWLEGEIQRRQVESELADAVSRFETLSRIDPLTESLNRRGLTEHLERWASRAVQDDSAMGVILIDLDDFKSVNDEHGYSVGDRVIRQTAESIDASIRPGDVLARIGGDEFMALLPGCTSDADCLDVAERICEAVSSQEVMSNGALVRATCSVGALMIEPRHASVTDIVGQVENLLQRSKQLGKNRVVSAAREETAASG